MQCVCVSFGRRSFTEYTDLNVFAVRKVHLTPAAWAILPTSWLKPSINGMLASTIFSAFSSSFGGFTPVFFLICRLIVLFTNLFTNLSITFCILDSSSLSSCWSLQICNALFTSPVITPPFVYMGWCESNCTYLLVCVGFWKTFLFSVPSVCLVKRTSM